MEWQHKFNCAEGYNNELFCFTDFVVEDVNICFIEEKQHL